MFILIMVLIIIAGGVGLFLSLNNKLTGVFGIVVAAGFSTLFLCGMVLIEILMRFLGNGFMNYFQYAVVLTLGFGCTAAICYFSGRKNAAWHCPSAPAEVSVPTQTPAPEPPSQIPARCCGSCGEPAEDGDMFCLKCGSKL